MNNLALPRPGADRRAGTTTTVVNKGPGVQASDILPTFDGHGVLQTIGSWITGNPKDTDVDAQGGKLYTPDRGNYTITGVPNYQNQQAQLGQQAQNYANNYASANSANAGRFLGQSGVAPNELNNAYSLINRMAQGAGPSLAAANLQAGLNSQNRAAQSLAMSTAGNTGLGNSQRNLLNAQAANANNVQQAGAQASVAEQMGATQQLGQQAANMAGVQLAQRGQDIGLSNQTLAQNYGAQNNANQAQYNSANNAFGANVAQAQSNQAYDQALQNRGQALANIGMQSIASGAKNNSGLFSTIGNIAKGIAGIFTSDENLKTDVSDTRQADLSKFLKSLSAPTEAPGSAAKVAGKSSKLSSVQLGEGIKPLGGFESAVTGSDEGSLGTSLGNSFGAQLSDLLHKPTGVGSDVASPTGQWLTSKSADQAGAGDLGMSDEAGGSLASLEGDEGKSGGALGGLGSLGGIAALAPMLFSDENVKENVSSTRGNDLHEFAATLKPKSYNYIPEAPKGMSPGGRNHGIMAQDMERSKIGRDIVMDTPHGKVIDMRKAMGASLASLSYLNSRLDKLEKGGKRGRNA